MDRGPSSLSARRRLLCATAILRDSARSVDILAHAVHKSLGALDQLSGIRGFPMRLRISACAWSLTIQPPRPA